MHYIRLLRPPAVSASSLQTVSLQLVLTITTDLGDAFLCPDQPVGLAMVLEAKGARLELSSTAAKGGGGGREGRGGRGGGCAWVAGMRVLKLNVILPAAVAARWRAGDFSGTGEETGKGQPGRWRICIGPADDRLAARHAVQLSGRAGQNALIVPLWVDMPASLAGSFAYVAVRRLAVGAATLHPAHALPTLQGPAPVYVEVEEDMGESIARHVWDAGLVALGFVAAALAAEEDGRTGFDADAAGLARTLHEMLMAPHQTVRVLELGTGVGVLGIGLATVMAAEWRRRSGLSDQNGCRSAELLLTDLPEAEERAESNMARFRQMWEEGGKKEKGEGEDGKKEGEGEGGKKEGEKEDERSVDNNDSDPFRPHLPHSLPLPQLMYESLDWNDGCSGVFGPRTTAGLPWHLVMLSDCTYNVDMLPALVQTLSALQTAAETKETAETKEATAATRVLLARKPRHSSEEALFSLLADAGWEQQAGVTLPLPVLGGQDEAVELRLYGKAEDKATTNHVL